MFRLYLETDTKDIPCVHDSIDAFAADSLHSLGQKLSARVNKLPLA